MCLSTGKDHFVPYEVNLSLFLSSKPESLRTITPFELLPLNYITEEFEEKPYKGSI